MESLPLELVEKVAEYLTPQELAACCAVSVGWRDVFNQDSLWKPHCDKDMAQYLETAECRVRPGFVSPESEDSTLSPVCRWRLSYMRQNHLHNNWRRWKYVRDELKQDRGFQSAIYTFVSQDHLINLWGTQAMLWDLRKIPKLLGNPFHVLCDDTGYDCDMLSENSLVVVKSYTVEVYEFKSISDKNWPLKYFFFIDGTEPYLPIEAPRVIPTKHEHGRIFNVYIVTHGFFVGFTMKHSYVFHVWDLREGRKLARVECPVVPVGFDNTYCTLLSSEKQSTDFVVVVRYGRTNSFRFNFHVYSLTQLDFLPFQASHEFYKRDIKYVLHDKFLVIADDRTIHIYDYLASTLILSLPSTGCDILAVGRNILITEKQKLHSMFNTKSLKIEPLTVTNSNRVPPTIVFGRCLSDRFFYIIDHQVEVQIWEVGRNSKPGNVTWINSFKHLENYKICKSATKLIFTSSFYGCTFNAVSFW